MNLTNQEKWQANQFEAYSKYIHTWESRIFLNLREKIIGLLTGNKRGKGALAVIGYFHRIIGSHPVPERNVNYAECYNGHKFSPIIAREISDGLCPKCAKPHRKQLKMHQRTTKIIRFAGDILPESEQSQNKKRDDAGAKEVRCVQYIEFMKWMPPFLIKHKPSTRRATIEVKDIWGGDNIVIEFVSYKSGTDTTRGHDRVSIWADELGSEEFYDEQHPRLIVEKGDFIITYTVTDETKSTILFDLLYDRARVIYRTKTIVEDYYKKILNKDVKQIERTNSSSSIAVIQAASDDNPILTKEDVEEYLSHYPDPEVQMMRRYCAWQQLSAKIFPQFEWGVHAIDTNKILNESFNTERVGALS